ncbi:hypothetical protein H5410_045566, partial [Solanum commersonii]
YQTEDDKDIQTEEGDVSPLFPKIGHPIGSENIRKGKSINMEQHEWSEAHQYTLFNTGDEQVETFIKEHKSLIDNRIRENAWVKARVHSREFERLLDVDVRWLREDLPVDIIDVPSIAQHSQDVAMETSEEDDDVDDTDWDWMEADD